MNNFKNFLSLVIKKIFKIINFFISYSTFIKIKSLNTKFYTFWILNEFKSFGSKSSINYPLDLKGGKYIIIGEKISIGKNSILNAWDRYQDIKFSPKIIIGNNTSLGEGCHISAITKIIIGNNVLTGRRVSIIDNSHGDSSINDLKTPTTKRKLTSKGPIIIENNVWIGDKVTILSGVTIGANSIIGANSVVTKNIPENSIVGGVPAKKIKTIQ
jgi:acetyltransferase-like isoleucine patch superfamily enzyme